MAATIKGTAVKWSVGTIDFTAGIVTTDARMTQSARVQRTSEKTNIKDIGGTVKTQVFHGAMKTLSITVVPSGRAGVNTVTEAERSADAHMPAPGTLVTVTDLNGTTIDDNYNVLSATENLTVDGVMTIDLELEAGDEGTELATAPIT